MTSVSVGTGGAGEAARVDRSARLGDCLERARAGERSALDEVVRELTPLLWHVARGEGLGSEDAADVVQTVWLELLRRLGEIRSSQALTGWLVTAARREAWRVRKSSRRRVAGGTDVLETAADPGPQPHEGLLTDERDTALWRHFSRLSERCRRLLWIVAQVHRPDYAVVSEALGMPLGSVGPTRGRCLARLREMLQADPGWGAS